MEFIRELISSIPFLVPLVITWITYRAAPKTFLEPLSYVLTGFLIGFIARVILSVVIAYIIQLPLLPLKLHQEGMNFKEVSMIISTYNIAYMLIGTITSLISLTLVGYGIYELVSVGKNASKITR